MKPTLVLAAPDGSLRERLVALLSAHDVNVVTTASQLRTCLMKVRGYTPDFCLIDASLLDDGVIPDELTTQTRWVSFGDGALPRRVPRSAHPKLQLSALQDNAALIEALGSALDLAVTRAKEEVATCSAASRSHCLPTQILALGIGVSTGGPQALREVLGSLPSDFPVPILVAQHIPEKFSTSLATSLDQVCPLQVVEAQHDDVVRAGRVYLAPGGRQMRVIGDPETARIAIGDDIPANACRPSVNVLFRSLLAVYDRHFCAVVMTGMGDDGLDACVEVHRAGGYIIAQEASTCTVYGMPRAIVENGIASQIVGLTQLADAIRESVR